MRQRQPTPLIAWVFLASPRAEGSLGRSQEKRLGLRASLRHSRSRAQAARLAPQTRETGPARCPGLSLRRFPLPLLPRFHFQLCFQRKRTEPMRLEVRALGCPPRFAPLARRQLTARVRERGG